MYCFAIACVAYWLGRKKIRIGNSAGDLGMGQKLQFPAGFRWGTATASFQIEGGAEHRGRTIWDEFCGTPGKVHEGHTGAVACNHYHRFRDDVRLLADLGARYYRFSVSWARLFPRDGELSAAGVQFYTDLVAELRQAGIAPVVTLYHWDLPVWVQEKCGGWAGDGGVVQEFEVYARAVFEALGDSVEEWITINEPWCVAVLGYEVGEHAPGETDSPGRKVYVAAHNLLLAHARAVRVYRAEFAAKQKGVIGITLNADWAEPGDAAAARRDMEFSLGWFAHPVYFGDYPRCMRDEVGDRLPAFSAAEKAELRGSSDFFGLNHYSTHYTTGLRAKGSHTDFWNDKRTEESHDDKWDVTDMGWPIVPRGFAKLLKHVSDTYTPKGGIIVTENGLAAPEATTDAMKADTMRISYYERYIGAMHEAIQQGADVRGYMLWSFLDNFEWAHGYSKRFGLYRVDYDTLERTPKPAVEWYKKVIKENAVYVNWTDEQMGLPK